MAELNGLDDEFPELKQLNYDVQSNPDDFEAWEKLVRASEVLEGGLNRNSSPSAISAVREIFNKFLAKFPLFFGYWKKYADLEFSIAGTESAEMVFERGVASITTSVDLWKDYCNFKVETCHDSDAVRELFERAASYVGLDFMSHPFWDKYIEFEQRMDDNARVFALHERIIHIPMHQYARYFDRYRQLAQHRPLTETLPPDVLNQFKAEIESITYSKPRSEIEIEREIRTLSDKFYLEIFHSTQTETTRRWTYEQEIKRPYFHVTELEESQLVNWRVYLDFEEVEGNYARIVFLYERCLIPCAYYDEFWFRYARWMSAQANKEEETCLIYTRASCLFVPIARPSIRLNWAAFEEAQGRVGTAKLIHEAILDVLPGHLETIISLANLERRNGSIDDSIEVFKTQIDSPSNDIQIKGAIVAEWARILWTIKGSVEEARTIFQKNSHWYMGVRTFWIKYFQFELAQPTSQDTESIQYDRIKHVMTEIRDKSQLPLSTIKDIAHEFMVYLVERGGKNSAKEYIELDREVNGPFSVQRGNKSKLSEDGNEATTQRRMVLENGHPGLEVNQAAINKGENPYTKYYQQQGETSDGAISNGKPSAMRY